MLRNVLSVALLSALVAGCEVTEDMAVSKASDMVASQLKDPSSAKFSELSFIKGEVVGETQYGYLCGKVNSRNSFGGFTGDIRFAVSMKYSKSGDITISYLELEEGKNAKAMSEGRSYFEHFYWNKRCYPGVASKISVGQFSKPSKMILTPRERPDVFSAETSAIPKGEVVKIYAMKDGWVQVSPDPKSPRWIVPELLDW